MNKKGGEQNLSAIRAVVNSTKNAIDEMPLLFNINIYWLSL